MNVKMRLAVIAALTRAADTAEANKTLGRLSRSLRLQESMRLFQPEPGSGQPPQRAR